MNDCDKYRRMIARGFEGALGDEDAAALSAHLESCAGCRAEFEIANFADGLMLAVAAPEIDAEVWQRRSQALGLSGDDDLGLPADALRPPDVSNEEWDRMWLDIERGTLLDGIAQTASPAAASETIRRTRLRRALSAFAAAAVLVVAVVAAYIHFSPQATQGPPKKIDDVTTVSRGYLYSRVDTGGRYPVHEIALTDDARGVEYLAPGRGYLASGDSGVAEIAAAGNMRTSRVSTGAGYMYSPAEKDRIDEIGASKDLAHDDYEEIPEFSQDEPSSPPNDSGDDND